MIIILSPQANILKKENDSSMQYVLNQLLSNKEGIETKVIDRTYINNFVFKFQFINKILSKIFILKYWYI